ncbi:c-type cytochrome [Desulfuromonas versatilis]|uniref:C-type cytochrome n=1 Tax=Desulfuromonas versatilis TaxID=2802975 RepID=A0ABM8HVS0_9BACT|nr:selenite/tellurite reduction operon b-type cytochrome iron-sulfur cluster-binding subunit ExtO [Desulfuromonas versatilis]BCR06084.1 c-type cytochrome [Desulfuromonas versatilis]
MIIAGLTLAWSALALLRPEAPRAAGEDCAACHRVAVRGAHGGMECGTCHGGHQEPVASATVRAQGCTGCHRGYDTLFDQAMTHRSAEKEFVARTWGRFDPGFFSANCGGCHLTGCLDCHGDGHAISRPGKQACQRCHKGYFAGSEFDGRAPREDHQRYLRGADGEGEPYLKMLPDLHAELGMQCADCHSMASLAQGAKSSRGCADCHDADSAVPEHRVAAHLEKLECYACHSAWAAQEYGTFYLRLGEGPAREYFQALPAAGAGYVRSAYLRQQNAPPLGVNARGRVSPVRPQFIAYLSDLRGGRGGEENRLLEARWQAFFPHSVRSGSLMCDGCHGAPRRFLLEPPEARIYRIDLDGLGLSSFWAQEGQQVGNGAFLDPARFPGLSAKNAEFRRLYVEKWKKLVDRVEE